MMVIGLTIAILVVWGVVGFLISLSQGYDIPFGFKGVCKNPKGVVFGLVILNPVVYALLTTLITISDVVEGIAPTVRRFARWAKV